MVLDKKKKDEILVERLELMNDYVVKKHQLEKLVKSGCLHLAKARYVDGRPNYISTLQLPSCVTDKQIRALYSVKLIKEDEIDSEEGDKENDTNKDNLVNNLTEGKETGFSIGAVTDSQFQLIKHEDVKENPLRWFGVLVSHSLRNAQTDFQKCIDLTVHITNIQLKLHKLDPVLK